MLLGWLLACHGSDVPGTTPEPTEPGWTLDALSRLSLDLRGVRPTIEEVEAAEADLGEPIAWTARVHGWLRDPRFGPRVRDTFAGIYRTRQEAYAFDAADYGLSDPAAFAAAVGDEPLRILSTIAEEDLPYTDIVLADWTMADENVAAAAPVDYPEGEEGWQRVRYTDGRPVAGVLATNGMWWHYTTTFANASRGRANAVSRILLCQDYLSRPVPFDRDVDLLDAQAVADALRSSPGCVACHHSLDPLASFLFGFQPLAGDDADAAASYHADRESNWRLATGVAPAYYGVAGDTLADLGAYIAADPRLTQCVTEQVYGSLSGREPALDDTAALLAHHEAFVDGGLTLRTLYASIAQADAYRSAPATEGRTKMVSVEQLGGSLEDLTGFRFTHEGYDLLTSDTNGVRSLADGVDGVYATLPNPVPTATSVLVQARVAQAAAWYAAAREHENPAARRLFAHVTFRETPETDPDAMVRQAQALRARVHGALVAADGPEVAADLALWSELYAIDGDPEAAWAGVLSVLLREPAFVHY